jgi:H(+)-transporting ATP synthase, vacuolar type, subunit D
MEIKVNATRMELLKLKNRLKMAKRGHKLLKDKRDELMREFLGLVHKNRSLRQEVEQRMAEFYKQVALAFASTGPDAWASALSLPEANLVVRVDYKTTMNLRLPQLEHRFEGEIFPYGFAQTSGDLDNAILVLAQTVPMLLELAAVERAVDLLSQEIEKTRRRVNALEYILIPELEAKAAQITMRLAELERSGISRLMKVKDIVRAH